jgi:hypothetical protein
MTVVQSRARGIVRSRRLFVVILILVFAVLAVRAVSDVWMGRRLEAEIARLEQQYGPLRWDNVRKLDAWKTWPRRISPENRARMIDAAAARITVSDADEDLLHRPNVPSTMPAEKVREIADENRDAVQLAIRGARLSHSNWDITYGSEPGNVPNLMDLGYLSRVLAIAARSDTDAGRADDATADVMAGFAEAAAMRDEPVLVMLGNAMGVALEQEDALKDVLNRADPSGPALASLAAVIDENLVAHPARVALLGELKHSRAAWPLVEQGWLWGRRFLDYHTPEPPSAWMRGVAWFFRPVIRFMAMRDLSDKARAVEAASVPRAQRAGIDPSFAPAPGLIQAGDLSTATVGRAAIAVALRRFRLDYGTYPNQLDQLAPMYIKTVPLDPFTDQQPEYRRLGAGFELPASSTGLKPPAPMPATRPVMIKEWKVSR